MPKRKPMSQRSDYKSIKRRKQRREEGASTSRFVSFVCILNEIGKKSICFTYLSTSITRLSYI